MSWIRLVIVFWTSQPQFIYLVHSRAGLQSKLCTEDNLEILMLKTWSNLFVAYASNLEEKNPKST